MSSGKTRTCHACNFPIRRGRLPIIWPGKPWPDPMPVTALYCSVACLESATGITLPEPMRTMQLAAESAA